MLVKPSSDFMYLHLTQGSILIVVWLCYLTVLELSTDCPVYHLL